MTIRAESFLCSGVGLETARSLVHDVRVTFCGVGITARFAKARLALRSK